MAADIYQSLPEDERAAIAATMASRLGILCSAILTVPTSTWPSALPTGLT